MTIFQYTREVEISDSDLKGIVDLAKEMIPRYKNILPWYTEDRVIGLAISKYGNDNWEYQKNLQVCYIEEQLIDKIKEIMAEET